MLIFTSLYIVSALLLLTILSMANRNGDLLREDAAKFFWVAFIPLLNIILIIAIFITFPMYLLIEFLQSNTISNCWNSFIKWIFPNE